MSKADLRLDWCSYQAAKWAVEHWHYSKTMPAGRNVFIGVYECGTFIGCVMFGMGSGNSTNGSEFGLNRSHEIAELTRVALTNHQSSVSRIVSIAISMIKKQSPKLRLIKSMADPVYGHVGGIYQAGNWIYTGETKPDVKYLSRGEFVHHRTATSRGSAKGLPKIKLPSKYRYLYPLDDAMRAQIEPLRKPYPKRIPCGSGEIDSAPRTNGETGGASPTDPL